MDDDTQEDTKDREAWHALVPSSIAVRPNTSSLAREKWTTLLHQHGRCRRSVSPAYPHPVSLYIYISHKRINTPT